MKLSDNQLSDALRHYGHSFSRLDFVQSGYRNTSHIVETTTGLACNLIVYKREVGIAERIQRINELSSYVHGGGLPVRYPIDERILQLRGSTGVSYASLYSFEHGATIPWESYTMKHIKLLGMAMGRFHLAAREYKGDLPLVVDECRAIIARMQRYFADPNVEAAVREKLGVVPHLPFSVFLSALEDAGTMPDQQALHMDFVRGNVLFRTAEETDTLAVSGVALSGILDLEKAAYGHPVFDIARTLAFLMVDCNKPAEKVYRYFLHSGYVKRGVGSIGIRDELPSDANSSGSLGANGRFVLPRFAGKAKPSQFAPDGNSSSALLERLITLFLVYDFYKFLRQNPYESLAENHHFVRTRDILVERKVLQ